MELTDKVGKGKACIVIETQGSNPQTYYFDSVKAVADAYSVTSVMVLRSIQDGRPINRYGVYVDEALDK